MLNKDEYNQEDYNDYYRQEVEGAEIEDHKEEADGSSLISKLIVLLILLALLVAGYFGYKGMNNVLVDETSAELSLPQSVQKTPTPINITEVKPEPIVIKEVIEEVEPVQNAQSSVTSKVVEVVKTQGNMSPEEVAAVVTAVMQKINQQKTLNVTAPSVALKQDNVLISELSNSEVDSVSADLIKELEGINMSENTKVNNTKEEVDVYNKVNVQNTLGSDTLSELSDQINSVIQEGISKNKAAHYTDALKSEVAVRKNEMRIIVVREGDTLGRISKRAYGNVMEYRKIYRANPELTRPDRIYIGQKLRIPN